MKSIGIVDDNLLQLAQLQQLAARAGFTDIRAHADPRQALSAFLALPPAVLVIDYSMPGLDGVALLQRLQHSGAARHTPVALVSGCADLEAVRISAYRAGAHEILTKPLRQQEFALVLRNLSRLARPPEPAAAASLFQPLRVPVAGGGSRQVNGSGLRDPRLQRLLARVASAQGGQAGQGAFRMAHYAAAIARHLGMDLFQQEQLQEAAPLHDIGRVGVPEGVLAKRGPLTPLERQQLEHHTVAGQQLLHDDAVPLLCLAAEIAWSHHERWDGTGYPQAARGTEIPLSGRIVAVADAFESLTSLRLFTRPWAIERAMAVIGADNGRRFDPVVVRAFTAAAADLARIQRQFGQRAWLSPLSERA
ncbi:MAG: response regulator [Aquabacterium sp.]|nr:response regulator [Aquabacterium sp.]